MARCGVPDTTPAPENNVAICLESEKKKKDISNQLKAEKIHTTVTELSEKHISGTIRKHERF